MSSKINRIRVGTEDAPSKVIKEEEEKEMKAANNIAKKGFYIGAGAGLLMFVAVGLLPSSFIGGFIGLQIGRHLFGTALAATVLPRVIVGLSMILGILVAGLFFVGSSSII